MKANCKKWKSLLCISAAALFVIVPLSTQAADIQVRIMNDSTTGQETTPDKMNSTDKAVVLAVTAGAADVLNAKISILNDETAAKLMDIKARQKEPKKEEESTLVMAKVNEYVNIRVDADQNSERVGVLYKDCGGDLIEKGEEWSKIKSGDVTGWVKNQYLYFGDEAEKVANDVGNLTAYATTETLRVRKEPSLEADIVGLLAEGQAVEAIAEEGEWVKVSYEGTTGFVSAEYVRVEFDIDTAESIEKIKEREAAEAARIQAEAKAKRNEQKAAVLASASDLEMLAAIIQCEAGGEPYEGQVAVGAVVMNRVRSAGYPNTIPEVIYASGQFSPAGSGRMESLILSGNIKASCMQAAIETINGVCNVGDALHFRRNNGSRSGLVIGNHVFY